MRAHLRLKHTVVIRMQSVKGGWSVVHSAGLTDTEVTVDSTQRLLTASADPPFCSAACSSLGSRME